jgi:hypothetical protein
VLGKADQTKRRLEEINGTEVQPPGQHASLDLLIDKLRLADALLSRLAARAEVDAHRVSISAMNLGRTSYMDT